MRLVLVDGAGAIEAVVRLLEQVIGQLPIAGTWVNRLLGTWQVQVRLGRDSTVLGAQKFTFTR